jgi:hypothetical protein
MIWNTEKIIGVLKFFFFARGSGVIGGSGKYEVLVLTEGRQYEEKLVWCENGKSI